MPAVPKVPLGAATLVRKWHVDGNAGTHDEPQWLGLFGMTDVKFSLDPDMQDDSDMDSEGWKSESPTAIGWAVETTVERKMVEGDRGSYNPCQELFRQAAFKIDGTNHIEVRIYEMTPNGPRVEAYQGYASVQWKPAGGDMAKHDTVAVTLSGQGLLTAITHPDASAVPRVYSITPATAPTAGGELHTIVGSGFTSITGAAGVKFGGTNATDYNVIDDHHIAAISPARTAGAQAVVVTNGTGPSTDSVSVTYS